MRYWCLAIVALGCAEMPASDDPLAAVVVEEPAKSPAPGKAEPVSPKPSGDTGGVFEDVAAAAKRIAKGQDPTVSKAKAKAKAKMAKAKAKAKAKMAKARAKARTQAQQGAKNLGGPIKLVAAVPNAAPPRAILSLSDGKEIVVKPGQMVPLIGLVVLSIEANKVEIMRVVTEGNVATMRTEVLEAAE